MQLRRYIQWKASRACAGAKKRRKRIVHFPLLGVGVCLRGLRVFVCLEAAVKILIVQLIRCVEERRPAAHSNFNRNAQKRYAKISAINSRTILYITQRKSFFYISSLFEYFFLSFIFFSIRFRFALAAQHIAHWKSSIFDRMEWHRNEMLYGKITQREIKMEMNKGDFEQPATFNHDCNR